MPPYILQSETDWRDSYRKISRGGKAIRRYVLCKSPWCHQPSGRLSGGQRLSGKLVCWAFGRAGSTQCLRCQVRQVEHRRPTHPTAEVAVSGVCQHQKAVWYPAKAHAPPGRRQHREQLRCRVVRLGDLKEKRDLIMSKSNLQTTHAERETGKPLLSTVTMANLKYLKWNKQPSTCSLCK